MRLEEWEAVLMGSRIFNTGSPYNVVAGHGARNMDKVVEHYKQKYAEEDARRTKETARREAVEAAKKG